MLVTAIGSIIDATTYIFLLTSLSNPCYSLDMANHIAKAVQQAVRNHQKLLVQLDTRATFIINACQLRNNNIEKTFRIKATDEDQAKKTLKALRPGWFFLSITREENQDF